MSIDWMDNTERIICYHRQKRNYIKFIFEKVVLIYLLQGFLFTRGGNYRLIKVLFC